MFEQIYGKQHCTINIHLHGHLRDCIMDFGPVYSFWLFSFERLNGVLGSYHTNYHDILLQIMRRFLSSHSFGSSNWPEKYVNDFSPLLARCSYSKGSLLTSESVYRPDCVASCTSDIEALPPVSESAWLPHQKEALYHISKKVVTGTNYNILTL